MPIPRFNCSSCLTSRQITGVEGTLRVMPCGHCSQCCMQATCYATGTLPSVMPPGYVIPPRLGQVSGPAPAPVKTPSRHSEFGNMMVAEVRCDKCNVLVRGQIPVTPKGERFCPSCGVMKSSGFKNKRTGAPYVGPVETGVDLPFAWVPKKNQLKLNPSPRLVGLEIEIDKYVYGKDIDLAVMNAKGGNHHDGTAGSGLEIGTAPAGGDLFVQKTRELSESIRAAGAKCGSDIGGSGLHVHVDASDMDYSDLRKVAILYSILEPAIYSIIDPRRAAYGGRQEADTHFCKPIGPGLAEALRDPATAREDLVNVVCDKEWLASNRGRKFGKQAGGGDRYKGLNLWSWWIRGTVEYRMHHGTTQWQKMVPFGMLLASLHDTALRISEADMWKFPAGKAGLLKLAPDCPVSFCKTPLAEMKWGANDGVRQWVTERWDYFAGKRKDKGPVLPKIDF